MGILVRFSHYSLVGTARKGQKAYAYPLPLHLNAYFNKQHDLVCRQ